MKKICKRCNLLLDVKLFYSHAHTKDGLRTDCKDCSKKRAASSHKKRRLEMGEEQYKKKTRAYSLKRKFGVSQDEHDKMLEAQSGKCAICGLVSSLTLHVDHDHATGLVRGLLCRSCNIGLGHFNDDLDLLLKAMKYLGVAQGATDPCKIG